MFKPLLRERLAGGHDAPDVFCPHTLALNALRMQANVQAMTLPALAQDLPRRKPPRAFPGSDEPGNAPDFLAGARPCRRTGGPEFILGPAPGSGSAGPRINSADPGAGTRSRGRGEIRTSIPILTYHRVAPDGPKRLARYRVTPDRFAQQIRHLRKEGFRSVTPEELLDALSANRPLRGRPVMLTFDDGYADFAEHAWPILAECGFTAVLLVVPDKVGGRADWDARFGDPAPLLDWPDIAVLAREGVSIESHSATHRPLSSLEAEAIYWEALSSAAAIERVVGRRPMAFSYPFGALDPVVERVVEECGYRLGFAATTGVCSLASDPLRLSRLEIIEADDPLTVSRKIGET